MPDQREELERLERRVAQLEALVRQMVAERGLGPPRATRPTAPIQPSLRPAPRPATSRLAPEPRTLSPEPPARADWEQWVGQRGLLAVGVLALLATGGFFLNYAFERGWVPEWLRATAAVLAGVAVAAWGDRLIRQGLRRYGAALIGAGGGLVYLGFWAAAGPYALVGKDIGVLLLGGTAVGVASFAARHEIEALAVWALVGAYGAPAFLPHQDASVEKFLAYTAVVGGSSLYLGSRFQWRVTFDVALFGFYFLPLAFAADALESVAAVNYVAFGGAVALLATHHTPWPEARIGALGLPWLFLLAIAPAAESEPLRWTALASGLILAAVVWWQHVRRDPLAGLAEGALASPLEALVYVASPLAAVYLAAHARPDALASWGGAVALALAVLYLGAGWPRRSPHLVGMGMVLLALAISGQWNGLAVAVGWGGLAVAAVAADRSLDQRAARDVALGVAMCAFLQLFTLALADRPAAAPAFTDRWALGWYAVLAATAAAAAWWRPRTAGDPLTDGGSVLWLAAGTVLLLGGSLELQRLLQSAAPGDAGRLAGHVATAIYWLLAAAALVQLAPRWVPSPIRTVALMAAVALSMLSFILLFTLARDGRPAPDPAFAGVWSLGWYAQCALPMLAAHWWSGATTTPSLRPGAAVLWSVGGVALLLGGAIELHRFFEGRLAGDLAISTFWLVYAAALVRIGFRRDEKLVRTAGLAVAGLAVVKIVFYDLSELEALYRVGSFFVLALISLAVAYAYNKKASR